MKVIAATDHSTVLIEANAEETSYIQGLAHEDRYGNRSGLPRVGSEIRLSQAWKDLCRFRSASGDIEKAAEVLRAVAQLAETASASYVLPETTVEAAK